MNNKYEPVIGLEIHVELNTKSKMFCSCPADYFGKTPNSQTCPICLGLPGALPFINKAALEKCIKIGLALKCEMKSGDLFFERKNYFYPDLSKGYQLSQYRWPLCINGYLDVPTPGGNTTKIRINRVHQEEDTGKLTHINGGTEIDFNRSGVPLVEIVTEPDFKDVESVKAYAKMLQQVFRTVGASDADMEKGQMRLEANVSVRLAGSEELPPYRVELKNINSFNFMSQAIEYEIKRQIEVLEKGETITQHTRGWDENKKETFVQREKEEANDYRYFPDPDLPPLILEDMFIDDIASSIPAMPWEKEEKLIKDFNLPKVTATTLISKGLSDLFIEAAKVAAEKNISAQEVANFLINSRIDLSTFTPEQVVDKIISGQLNIVTDPDKIETWVKEAMSENTKAVEDYKLGKLNAIGILIGSVMKKSEGKADTKIVRMVIEGIIAR